MDVKLGSGAFMADRVQAEALAHSLVRVARGGGLPTVALLTDMNQVLGRTAGNALELRESIDALAGRGCELRLREVTLALCAQLIHLGGLAPALVEARARAERAWDSGAAAERLARMVAALGGPVDVLRDAQLPQAPVRRAVPAPRAGVLAGCDVRALGLAVVALGGGRATPGQAIDPRVGLAEVQPLGTALAAGDPIAMVHAASESDAQVAVAAVQAAFALQAQAHQAGPIVLGTVED
jgi:thymidine phosphorylase